MNDTPARVAPDSKKAPVSPAAAPPVDPLKAARDKEASAVEARRTAAKLKLTDKATWGLALSGGGVRSATFCLGAVRALAAHKLLRRFDYLSTVSGGGYLGASLGRLYRPGTDAATVEAGIGKHDSLWLWWLRVNGRYLTPAGAKDLGIAGASIVRGVLASYFELTTLILLLVAAILLPHVLVSIGATMQEPWLKLGVLSAIGSAWGWLALVPLAVAAWQASAFWSVAVSRSPVLALAGAAAIAFFGWILWSRGWANYFNYNPGDPSVSRGEIALSLFAGLLLLMPLLGALQAFISGADDLSRKMYARTRRLALAMVVLTIMVVFGVVDAASWYIAEQLRLARMQLTSVNVALITTAIVGALRMGLPPIKRALAQARFQHINVERLLNILGMGCLALVVLSWTIAAHAQVIPAELWQGTLTVDEALRKEASRYALWFLVPLVYVVLSMRNFNALNFSSLHEFYRARIEAAYVSSGNAKGRFSDDPLKRADQAAKNSVTSLIEALKEDDVDITDYAPNRVGGPIHIVNCCINQSVDDRTDSYNADRKGVALGLSTMGVEVGVAYPHQPPKEVSLGPLSKWIAISGAAASTGMGSATSPGLATLLFLSGLRLGYWTPRLRDPQLTPKKGAIAWLRRELFGSATKPVAIVAETMARFPGLESAAWYVSDGGHFDNTAIYPLIKRKVDVIVAADCGADPNYLFEDLESLVRKARLDFRAEIEFYQANDKALPAELAELVESPEIMNAKASARCLVIGRITYEDKKEPGTLIVLKPRRLREMPFDLVAYADRERIFPQQSTADQFFDEAQWESYQRLGLEIGRKVTQQVIDRAIELTHGTAGRPHSLSVQPSEEAEKAEDRRTRASPAVRASIGVGLGVIVSAGLAIWKGASDAQLNFDKSLEAYPAKVSEWIKTIAAEPFDSESVDDLSDLLDESRRYGKASDYRRARKAWIAKCEGGLEKGSRLQVDARTACEMSVRAFENRQGHRYWMDDIAFHPVPVLTAPPVLLPMKLSAEGCSMEQAKGITLYTQIYDEDSMVEAKRTSAIASSWGFKVPETENVMDSAEKRGTKPPYVWSQPSLLVHGGVSPECVAELKQLLELPNVYVGASKGANNVIELWLPPNKAE